MILILLFLCGFILVRSGIVIKQILGLILCLAAIVVFNMKDVSFIPRKVMFEVERIVPMTNYLDSTELYYVYDDDVNYIFYVEKNGKKKEMKVSNKISNIDLEDTCIFEGIKCNSYAEVDYTDYTDIWQFLLFSKPIITSADINVPNF